MSAISKTLILACLILPTQIILAQPIFQNSDYEELIEEQTKKLQSELDLDDLQTVLVKNILIKYQKERLNLRDEAENREVLKEKIKEINLKQDEELSEILTVEQMTQLRKIRQEQRKQRGFQGKRRRVNRYN